MVTTKEIVRNTAAKLDLLTPMGDLKPLESLDLVSFTMALEEALERKIPSAVMFADNYASIDTVVAMLADLP